MTRGPGPSRFSLLDVSALVVGYSLASLLIRAYWPRADLPSFWALGVIGFVYAWLGLAMSGPVVLMIRRPVAEDPEDERNESRTWAELAWMIIGFYWIGLTILVVPVRMNGTRVLESAFLGVFPVLAAIVLRYFGPQAIKSGPRLATPEWTHRAALGLLLTWPFTWVGLILLGKTFL